jgi:hypothetical protein
MSQFYLLNSPILTSYGQWRFESISVQDARLLVQNGFISAIGHESTAQILSALLQQPVACQRISITMQPHDKALVFRLKQRLSDMRELSLAEIEQLPFELGLLTFLSK